MYFLHKKTTRPHSKFLLDARQSLAQFLLFVDVDLNYILTNHLARVALRFHKLFHSIPSSKYWEQY